MTKVGALWSGHKSFTRSRLAGGSCLSEAAVQRVGSALEQFVSQPLSLLLSRALDEEGGTQSVFSVITNITPNTQLCACPRK